MTALLAHGGNYGIADANPGLPGAVEQHPLVRQLATADSQCAQQARQGDSAGALDVIVEQANPVAVLCQQAKSVAVTKILQLYQRIGESCPVPH